MYILYNQCPYMIGKHISSLFSLEYLSKDCVQPYSDANMKEKLSNIRVRYDYGF